MLLKALGKIPPPRASPNVGWHGAHPQPTLRGAAHRRVLQLGDAAFGSTKSLLVLRKCHARGVVARQPASGFEKPATSLTKSAWRLRPAFWYVRWRWVLTVLAASVHMENARPFEHHLAGRIGMNHAAGCFSFLEIDRFADEDHSANVGDNEARAGARAVINEAIALVGGAELSYAEM
jgi:hypothetical protein